MPAPLHTVERTELDGVPVYRVETSGPAFGMLLFRLGRIDEPLTHAGVTHLVEHLAFHRLRHLPYEHNGATEPAFTRFFAEGEQDEVDAFLRTVLDTLVDPPLDRVRREARILAEEAAERNTDAYDLLRRSRHGATAHGRVGYPEYGLWWLDADAVEMWVAERFTRANAALVVAGDVPEGLGFGRLPAGAPSPLPPVAHLGGPTPRHHHGPDGVVLATLLTERTTRSMLAHAALERELEERLRHQRGLAYQTIAEAEPLDTGTKELLIGGVVRDSKPAEALAVAVGEMLDELAEHGPAPDLFDAARRKLLRDYRDPRAAAGSAVYLAECALTGLPVPDLAEDLAEIEGAAPADVADVVRESAATLVLTVPEGVDLDEARFGDCDEEPTDDPVDGVAHKEARIGRKRGTLVVGDDAVGIRFGDGSWWRVGYDDVAAVVWYADGTRELMTGDGKLFMVDPADWRKGAAAVAALDGALPPSRYTPLTEDGALPEPALPRVPPATSGG